MNAPGRCGAVGSLSELVMRHPELREVVRHYSPHFVPVALKYLHDAARRVGEPAP